MKNIALLLVCAVVLSGCQTMLVSNQEDLLTDSGFKATPADTPERQALLTRLPARQIMAGAYGIYVYADPLVCDCLYVGSDEAYSKYLRRVHFVGGSQGPPGSTNNVTGTSLPGLGFGTSKSFR